MSCTHQTGDKVIIASTNRTHGGQIGVVHIPEITPGRCAVIFPNTFKPVAFDCKDIRKYEVRVKQ